MKVVFHFRDFNPSKFYYIYPESSISHNINGLFGSAIEKVFFMDWTLHENLLYNHHITTCIIAFFKNNSTQV